MKIKVIYEDEWCVAVYKPAGVATQTAGIGQADVVSEVKNYLKREQKGESEKEPYAGLINRLDQPVEGIVLLAKTPFAAKELSKQIQNHLMKKEYRAVVAGVPEKQEDTLIDWLKKNEKTNLSEITTREKGGKKAELFYEVLSEKQCPSILEIFGDTESTPEKRIFLTELKITLKTGRHHQIRIQLSSRGFPILGDFKYGFWESMEISRSLGQKNIALCACGLSFRQVKTGKPVHVEIAPEGGIFFKN